MLISHRHKFIFIHVPKTAGTSVQNTLRPYAELGEDYGLGDHAKMLEVRKKFPEIFADYFKFAFVRNPWDYEVSMYHYKRQWFRQGHPSVKWDRDLNFEEFLLERAAERSVWGSQCRYLTDFQGQSLMDFVGRYENLDRDCKYISKIIGLPMEIPHSNASQRDSDYRKYYDESTQELVRRISLPEIMMFGYTFNSPSHPREKPVAAMRAIRDLIAA